MDEGPIQVWMFSRIDGKIRQIRVRPSKFTGDFIEEYENGFYSWPKEILSFSEDDAISEARKYFARKMNCAYSVLIKIGIKVEK